MLGWNRDQDERRSRAGTGRALHILSVLLLLAGFGVALVPAAPASAAGTLYVATTGSDAGDNTCADPTRPCATIQHAIDVASDGTTVQIQAGTYHEDLTLPPDKSDLRVAGVGEGGVIVTGVPGGSPYTITLTSPGATIEGLTLQRPAGVEDSIAIAWGYQAGGATVTFTTISGYPTGIYVSSGVDGATIQRNTITGNGNGILLEGQADNVDISMNQITGNNVTALEPTGGAGIRALPGYTGAGNGIHFNRIVGNHDRMGINNQSAATLDAINNWWGCNAGPGQAGCDTVSGAVILTPWLVLTASASPASIEAGLTSTVTASLKTNNRGEDTGGSGSLANGTPVSFRANPSEVGIVVPVEALTAYGTAKTTFTGQAAGTATIDVSVDAQTVTTEVEVTGAPKPVRIGLAASTGTPTAGQEVTLTATVTDAEGGPMTEVEVLFHVTGVNPTTGSATTDANGEASFSYTGTAGGQDTVTATVFGGEPSASLTLTWTVPSPPGVFPPAQPAQPKAGCTFYPVTQHNLCAGFRDYWNTFGGLATFGYPLTEEFVEDGVTVQYFERERFEWHPGAWPSRFDVLLGRLGAEITTGREGEAPFQRANPGAPANCVYFDVTGHNLCFGFRSYWEAFGGLPIYGYPISEEFVEKNPDTGQLYTVQYFERARFEWHPGQFPQRYDVLLGRLGAWVLHLRHGTPYP